jgi:copper(I)-binding protein
VNMLKTFWVLLLLSWIFNLSCSAQDLENEGKGLYLNYGCALCHGKNGDGNGISAQKFDPPPTDFRDPGNYRHGHDRESLRYSITRGIKEDNSAMPAFGHIPAGETDKIISYLISLQKKDIVVTGAWVRLLPPVLASTAAYMVIENDSGQDVILESASTDAALMADLHRTQHINGIMTMSSAEDIKIASHGRAVLAPGGLHVMLMRLKKPLKEGDRVPIILHFKGGLDISVNAAVRQSKEEE